MGQGGRPSPLRVALTGGIATGKSQCLTQFARLGAAVIDADQVAREVVTPGSPALENVVTRFGPGMRRADGELDRQALATIVFADRAARLDLEAILHPPVFAAIDAWLRHLAGARVAIADIPLLHETGHEVDFDRVVVAACRPAQQLERLRQRGYSLDEAAARLAAQLPIDEKTRRADYVIDTSGTIEETNRQVGEIEKLLR